jgi:hypothetical protein
MTSESIKKDIDQLFSDTSVSQSTTRDRLEDIVEHCRMLIETLPEDDE